MADNQHIVGNFELRNCIASTQIWEVVEQGGTVPMAMKLLLANKLKDSESKSVLKHEYKVGTQPEHPNLIRVHDLGMTRDRGFFTMDYFRAPTLKN